MNKKTILSDYVIDYFYKKNIKYIFTVSGGGSIFLCDSLQKSKKIKYVSCHHEQAVAFAAESYARHKRSMSGAVVTTGPGGTNTITGVASAWIDSVPILFVSGQVFLNQTIKKTGLRQLGVQEIDIVSLVKPITKYSIMVEDPNMIKYHLDKASYESTNGRPGPVWIDIPANIQNAFINSSKLKSFIPSKKNSSYKLLDKQIKNIAEKIFQSKKPLLHFGQGARISKSENLIKKFTEKYKMPFSLTWNATDLISSSNKYYVGRPGAYAERGSNFIVQNCDLFISVGSRLPFMVTGYNSFDFARKAFKVTVDIDSNETNKRSINFDSRITSDAHYFIKTLDRYLKNYKSNNLNWIKYCKTIRKKYPIVLKKFIDQKKYVNSYYFIKCLSEVSSKNETIVTDMGLSFVGTHQAFDIKYNQKLFTNSGHAPMGWGLPAAIGACFAKNKKQVICIAGDGGFQMNSQELATIMHHKLPIKIFLYNNGGYLTIKQTQQLGFNGKLMGSDLKSGLSFPKYSEIARAYKIKYFKIKNNKEIKSNIRKIMLQKGPIFCELIMDNEQEQMPKAINRRNSDGTSVPTTFEDMYPFLSEKELIKSSYDYFNKHNKRRMFK